MQKKKNEAGVTLVALVITVILIFIVAGISINLGDESIDKAEADKIKSELYMVQQAVVTQYAKAKSMNLTNIEVDNSDVEDSKKPEVFKGKRLAFNSIYIKRNFYLLDSVTGKYKEECKYYEDFYYKLEEEDLKTLGINYPNTVKDSIKSEYVVNYRTGEVYNYTLKSIDGVELYISSTIDLERLYNNTQEDTNTTNTTTTNTIADTNTVDNTFADTTIDFYENKVEENTIDNQNTITR